MKRHRKYPINSINRTRNAGTSFHLNSPEQVRGFVKDRVHKRVEPGKTGPPEIEDGLLQIRNRVATVEYYQNTLPRARSFDLLWKFGGDLGGEVQLH